MQTGDDHVALEIAGQRIENFTRYRIESDLFKAADDFSLTFEDPGVAIDPGTQCRVMVNGELEMHGIIDRVRDGYDSGNITLTVSGRDLMGLVVDSHVGTGQTDQDIELKDLAKDLLKDVPFINRKSIVYGKGDKAGGTDRDKDMFRAEKAQREPGKSIFDTLKDYAGERGLLFWCRPDGTFVFGRPVTTGRTAFRLVCRMDGRGNNVLSADRVRDMSGRYSQVTVIGQQQGDDWVAPEDINRSATAKDESFPFYKPYYTGLAEDLSDPKSYADLVLNQQRYAGFQLTYVVDGHSQSGRNFQANTLCHVRDEFFGYNQPFFVAARTFNLGKNGTETRLRLSLPGVVPL